MKVFSCDWCGEISACTQVNFNNKVYDLCQECREEIKKKLEGKGEAIAVQPCNHGYVYYNYSNYWCNTCQSWYCGPHIHQNNFTYGNLTTTYGNLSNTYTDVLTNSAAPTTILTNTNIGPSTTLTWNSDMGTGYNSNTTIMSTSAIS